MLMHSSLSVLACTLSIGCTTALDLDVSSQDSIKSVAKALASSIVAFYDASLEKDLIPGLFPDPYYWWESGLAFNTLVDYYGLTGDSEYNSRISEALQHQLGDFDAFMPANQTKTLGNDDQSFWALASLSAYEMQLSEPSSGSWLEYAKNVFDIQVARWDTKSCGGGLKWQIFTFNNGYNYKNSASNGQLFLLAARLAEHTQNSTYSAWANKIYRWTSDIGLVTDDQHVFDGTDDQQNCSSVNRIQWTANHAIFTEGAAIMYNVSSAPRNWTDILTGFVSAAKVFTGDDGTLTESACESSGNCDIDERAYKGIAIRSFARAAQVAPIIRENALELLTASAKGAASNCDGSVDSVACRLNWSDPSNSTWEQGTAANGNLGEVLNALQAVQGLLWSTIDRKTSATNSTVGSASPNSTTSSSPSGTSGTSGIPGQQTGAGATFTVSLTLILAITILTALGC